MFKNIQILQGPIYYSSIIITLNFALKYHLVTFFLFGNIFFGNMFSGELEILVDLLVKLNQLRIRQVSSNMQKRR